MIIIYHFSLSIFKISNIYQNIDLASKILPPSKPLEIYPNSLEGRSLNWYSFRFFLAAGNEAVNKTSAPKKAAAKKGAKKADSSKKRKKAKDSSDSEEDQEEAEESDNSDDEVNGEADVKTSRGGKNSGRGRGRGRATANKSSSKSSPVKSSGKRGRPRKS
jgi:hypothetical protein